MDVTVLSENAGILLGGFGRTLLLLLLAGTAALLWGTVLASFRVSSVVALRAVGTAYVTVFRNIPLVVLFLLIYYGLPEVDIRISAFMRATLALSLYTSAFVCEAVRSGVNSVATGQAEAARTLGMNFSQTLTLVVLPQALRAAIPPVASVLIALTKNTSIAASFGIAELTARMRGTLNNNAADLPVIFLGVALLYVLVVAVISYGAQALERHYDVGAVR
jgi:glutamate transport system permease protein